MEEIFIANIVYFLFAFFTIYPSTEIVSAGFTIPALFSSLLGSEQLYFIHYHIVRTCLTIAVHSLLPLGYYIFMGLCVPSLKLFSFECSIFWRIYLTFSFIFAVALLSLVYKWRENYYINHPLCKELKKLATNSTTVLASPDSAWKSVANEINIEFRRVDKFYSGTLNNRIYLTDNWFIKINLYSIVVCKNQDAEFVLTHSNDINLTYDSTPSIQYLNILVKPCTAQSNQDENSRVKFKPFYIFLNSFDYKDFNDKLNSPIKEACNIIIKQSLPDQFLDTVEYDSFYFEKNFIHFYINFKIKILVS